MFKIEVIGNLGADAKVVESNGSKFVTLRIAHSETWKDEKGEKHEKTIWIDAIMNDVVSKILPYLKQGVKVFVRGNGSLRVYSSPKDKCMKAGATINVREIELVSGPSDDVPKMLIDVTDGALYDVQKLYWVNRDNKKMAKDEVMLMRDTKGDAYVMNKQGFVTPHPEEQEGE